MTLEELAQTPHHRCPFGAIILSYTQRTDGNY